ncbi:MAG: hypothetical protein FWG10_13680 [Eubacteriaceae bacterium]|nr:hypothetical protein [Eubacteriaceae bacterium]
MESIKDEVDIVYKTLEGCKEITASAEYRELERMRGKIRLDEANAIRNAEKKAAKRNSEEIAQNY